MSYSHLQGTGHNCSKVTTMVNRIIPVVSLPVYLRSFECEITTIVCNSIQAFRRTQSLTIFLRYPAMRCNHSQNYNNLGVLRLGMIVFSGIALLNMLVKKQCLRALWRLLFYSSAPQNQNGDLILKI